MNQISSSFCSRNDLFILAVLLSKHTYILVRGVKRRINHQLASQWRGNSVLPTLDSYKFAESVSYGVGFPARTRIWPQKLPRLAPSFLHPSTDNCYCLKSHIVALVYVGVGNNVSSRRGPIM